MSDDEMFSFAQAREQLGESFDPLPVPPLPATDPDLDRVVAELRRLRDASAALANSEVELGDIADRLGEVAGLLESRVPSPEKRLENLWKGYGTRRSNPVAGPENPIAPPVDFVGCDDGSVMATLTLGPAYQGPPGCVHGGISALIIDHMMGLANHWAGRYGMTAHYELDYCSPTPLLVPLTFRCWVHETEGRKTWTHATIHAGDRLCVEARGLFLEASVPVPGRPDVKWNKGDAT
ncbi:aromatic compound degradation protein PaaI [Dietzia sp. NCCP-2495]|uniref:PaaI family thioesterase n=1 Tax=Dietzia sp. NCCP-2495 TaxID=2934675 RepID=UPI0022320663|nr:PaaI family thioesterase [Dietzia sp. NCCP-2495]GLB64277.1 aromatic compound degradation protein PaaI [Dietzia sp. NCCP-2495]